MAVGVANTLANFWHQHEVYFENSLLVYCQIACQVTVLYHVIIIWRSWQLGPVVNWCSAVRYTRKGDDFLFNC